MSEQVIKFSSGHAFLRKVMEDGANLAELIPDSAKPEAVERILREHSTLLDGHIIRIDQRGFFVDRTGDVFDRLTIILEIGGELVVCKCKCGSFKILRKSEVVRGKARSCGCLARELSAARMKEQATTHGDTSSVEFQTWKSMISRCYYRNSTGYERYGGVGVIVFDGWRHSYESFLSYVGRRPSPEHSIDRWPNNDGNYEPGNVRWATKSEQQKNRRNTIILTFNGVTKCATDWENEYGLPCGTLRKRVVLAGWPMGKALIQPISKKTRRFK